MRPIRWLRRGLTLVSLGAAGTAALVTARHVLETPQPLASALPGDGKIDRRHGGSVYYNVAGTDDALPLVLLHDFYPGASNYEFRHVFAPLAERFHVYAPDWLGFGMSEHPHIAYTGEFYGAMLTGFLRDVVRRRAVIIAQGRAANVAVRVAADAPDLIEALVLVAPDAIAGMLLDPTAPQVLARGAQRVSLGLVPYAVLATHPMLRRAYARRRAQIGDPEAAEVDIAHLSASAHQFGGQHALLALLAGALDLPIQNALALLAPPALVVGGADDPRHPREELEDLAVLNPHIDLELIPGAGESVAEDEPPAFVAAVTRWLDTERPPRQPLLRDEALAATDSERSIETLTIETLPVGPEDDGAPVDETVLEVIAAVAETPVAAEERPEPEPPAASEPPAGASPVAAEDELHATSAPPPVPPTVTAPTEQREPDAPIHHAPDDHRHTVAAAAPEAEAGGVAGATTPAVPVRTQSPTRPADRPMFSQLRAALPRTPQQKRTRPHSRPRGAPGEQQDDLPPDSRAQQRRRPAGPRRTNNSPGRRRPGR